MVEYPTYFLSKTKTLAQSTYQCYLLISTLNKNISLEYLLEDNTNFISIASESKFDVLFPITNTKLNWNTNNDFCFNEFQSYIQTYENDYAEIWISGFSDGGTGSFKMFYTHDEYFKGLISFNGYPQHNNFTNKVKYDEMTDKKIVFFGTKNDKQIQYEWSLAEYSKQKKFNPNTFIYVADGKHSFNSYKEDDFELLFKILLEVNNKDKESLHGLILDDKLIEFYDFRKSIVRKYGFGEEIYKENKQQKRRIKTLGNKR